LKLLQKFDSISNDSVLVIEGKKDKRALEQLGINANFFLLNNRRNIQANAEEISKTYHRAILLLDADKKGKLLTKIMKDNLQRLGVRVDTRLKNMLVKATNANTIEGMRKALE